MLDGATACGVEHLGRFASADTYWDALEAAPWTRHFALLPPTSPPRVVDALTGTRFLAAVAVVAFHFLRGALEGTPARALSTGFVAVGFFFVLSGFILVKAYGREPFTERAADMRFWRNRIARLYPVYVFSLALGIFTALSLEWTTLDVLISPRGALRVLAMLLVFPMLWDNSTFIFNWAAWSLLSEATFYLCFPFVMVRLRRYTTRRLVVIAMSGWGLTMVLAALYQALDPDHLGRPFALGDEVTWWGHWLKYTPLMHLHEFIMGVVAGVVVGRKNVASSYGQVAILGLLGAAFTIAYALVEEGYVFLHSGLLAPIFALLITLLDALRGGGIVRVLDSALMHFLGRASYALYLLHVPVFLLLAAWLPLSGVALFSVSLALTLALACTVYVGVEEPLRAWLRAPGR